MPLRHQMIERSKAVDTAVQIKDSKVGSCILKDNARQSNMCSSRVSRLEIELKRGQMHLEQQKKVFLKMRSARQIDPTILVVRPGSAGRRLLEHGSQTDVVSVVPDTMPSYMKPVTNKVKRHTRLATLDAFTRRSTRTLRPWQLTEDKRHPVFRSCAFPSAPLSTPELTGLQQTHAIQQAVEAQPTSDNVHQMLRQRLDHKYQDSEVESDADSFNTVAFITQITGLNSGEELNPRVRLVGIRSPDSSEGDGPPLKKTMDLPKIPIKGKKSDKDDENTKFKSRFAELEFKAKLKKYDDMTAPMANQWYRMKKRVERLPSADALSVALRGDPVDWS